MERDPRAFLWDVDTAVADIARFIEGLDEAAYRSSAMVRAAVERKFEIIGEALAQLARIDPALGARVPEYRRIIAFRNVIIHGYATVDDGEVWRIAMTLLPSLRAVVAGLLRELSGEDGRVDPAP